MVDVPTHDQLMWPTLIAIRQLGGSGTNGEILSQVIEMQGYSEDIQNEPHVDGRRTKLEYRLAWAKTYLKKGRAIDNSEMGVWSTTSLGEKLVEEDMREIVQDVRLKRVPFSERAKTQSNQLDILDDSQLAEPDEDAWKSSLLDKVISMSPASFERLAQRILRESGFKTVEVSGRTGDGGIDGTGVLQINLITFPVAFQCKKYQGSVGSPIVRDFRGAIMGRCEKGLLITTGNFTSDARREATRDGALAIDLVDGERLCELLKELSLGVETTLVEQISIDDRFFEGI